MSAPRRAVQPYCLAFRHAGPHGVLAAFHIPDAPDPVPEAALERLAPAERELARTLGGYRQVQFVGGRLALSDVRKQLGAPLNPSLPDPRGRPVVPAGWAASVSHKRTLAIAMVARDAAGTLGVDLEEPLPERPNIAERVLRAEELAEVAGLPPENRWTSILLRFSIKESIYKALDPYVQRYVGFHEAEVWPDLSGRARVQLHLVGGEGPFDVDARHEWHRGRLITSVRIKPGDTEAP